MTSPSHDDLLLQLECACLYEIFDSSKLSYSRGSGSPACTDQYSNPLAGTEDGANGLDGVVNRMKDLAVNRGDAMRRSKKDRASLKSSFREYHKAVEV